MTTRLNPYLSFRGNAREAMEFYHEVFGGDLTLTSFDEGGMPVDPAEKDLIMHGQLVGANDLCLMGSDTPSSMPHTSGTGGCTLSLSGEDESELRGYWDKLAEGGTVSMPLEKASWGDWFGQLTDRFGVPWLTNISGQSAG